MALTINGNHTGTAARTALRDRREYLDEIFSPEHRLNRLVEQIADDPVLAEIWDSGIVPAQSSFGNHIRIAEMLLQYKGVVPEVWPLPQADGAMSISEQIAEFRPY